MDLQPQQRHCNIGLLNRRADLRWQALTSIAGWGNEGGGSSDEEGEEEESTHLFWIFLLTNV